MGKFILIHSLINETILMIFVDRVREYFERFLLPAQFGFGYKTSTTIAIYATSCVIQEVTVANKSLYIAFTDHAAVYDWILQPMLFQILSPEN